MEIRFKNLRCYINDIVEEVLILSDMYDLDELKSLELLNTGN